MKFIIDAFKLTKEFSEVFESINNKKTPAVITGVSNIHKTSISYALAKQNKKNFLYLCSDEADCHKVSRDLKSLGLSTVIFPIRDYTLRDSEVGSREYETERLHALSMIAKGSADCVVATIDAALQLTIPKADLLANEVVLEAGTEISQAEVLKALDICGYKRAEQIEGIGQFSHRGGIIDFFPPGNEKPYRLEFWGDEIDNISHFDTLTQRRDESIDKVAISPTLEVIVKDRKILAKKIEGICASLRGKHAPRAKEILIGEAESLINGLSLNAIDKFIPIVYSTTATLFDYFDKDNSFIVFSEGSKLKEKTRTTLWQWSEDIKGLLGDGILCRGLDKYSEDWVYALSKAEEIPSFHMDGFARGTYEIPTRTLVNLNVKQLSVWGGTLNLLTEDLKALLDRKMRCVVLGGTEKAAQSLAEDLTKAGFPAAYFDKPVLPQKGTIVVCAGSLSSGIEIPSAHFALITHGRISETPQAKKAKKKDKNSKQIYSLGELNNGDYVVHSIHGIGIFMGINKVELKGVMKDYIKIQYAKSDTLYVPVTQLDMVAKYIGPREDSGVKLHRLGGAEWQKAKTRVRSAVKDIAKELIILYAKRMEEKGFSFPEDDDWQRDFEAHFEYDETDDQLRCIQEIKNDMESIIPMDRLLCGDVGFGKTEVALRAAFKCVTAGKQCALLVPTTILAWQHFQSIIKRFEGFPINVELLSRFRTTRQQNEIIRKIKRGSVDLVVGTHRIISKDVEFRDLGLAIIDEEQRFGVAQKERLKDVCKNADILTLSATPIPRTLNMALSGIRDMSVIEEAPHDRHPVQTYVLEHDMDIIGDAIKKELRRGGQVYYLKNDVSAMDGIAAKIHAKVPEARIGIGHGKMQEHELSEVWRQLLEHEIDVLVCTTIIETGVDVSNANTLIIEDADRMGLSQLHQIRGRVGRSNRRAYSYFTYTPNKVLSEISQKRLSAIREFTEFGSGFKIAMRDLEIRGAGNILGGEQHGHMESVGYDMYLKLLNEAVALLKGEEIPEESAECTIDIQMNAHIPEEYISSLNHRLDIYRRISDIKNSEDSEDVIDELIDRFGEPPTAVQGLIDIALLRNTAASLGIKEIKQQNESLMLYLNHVNMEQIAKLTGAMKGKVLLSVLNTPYLSVKLGGKPNLEVLSNVLSIMKA